jgi:hypothetical protein
LISARTVRACLRVRFDSPPATCKAVIKKDAELA